MVLEVMGVGGLIFIISMGAFHISTGMMPSENLMYVLYANYVAFGFRGLVLNYSKFHVTKRPFKRTNGNDAEYT